MGEALTNDNIVNILRKDLFEIIEKEKDVLVARTNERAAGHIQGLQTALALINEKYGRFTESGMRAKSQP